MTSPRYLSPLIAGLFTLLLSATSLAETVTVAAEDDWAPYTSINAAKNGPEGFTVDIVRAAFNSQGIDVKFIVTPFARCLHYAESGKTVACFNATIVKDNKETYYWHPTPLVYVDLLIFGRNDAPNSNMKLKDLEGKTVGSTLGYTYPTEFTKNQKIKHFGAKSDAQLVKMLAAGRVDYILLNDVPGRLLILADPKARGLVKPVGKISQDGFWLAFSKKHPDGKRLTDVFEKGMQHLHKSGQYKSMETAFLRKHNLDRGTPQ